MSDQRFAQPASGLLGREMPRASLPLLLLLLLEGKPTVEGKVRQARCCGPSLGTPLKLGVESPRLPRPFCALCGRRYLLPASWPAILAATYWIELFALSSYQPFLISYCVAFTCWATTLNPSHQGPSDQPLGPMPGLEGSVDLRVSQDHTANC